MNSGLMRGWRGLVLKSASGRPKSISQRAVARIEPLIERDSFRLRLRWTLTAGCPSAVIVARLILLVCHGVSPIML